MLVHKCDILCMEGNALAEICPSYASFNLVYGIHGGTRSTRIEIEGRNIQLRG